MTVPQTIGVNQYTCKDTFHFVILFKKSFAVSFDVESLFPSILLDEIIDLCINCLYHGKSIPPDMPVNDFKQLLIYAVKDCCFIIYDKMCMKLDGVTMGSLLGVRTSGG